MIPQGSMSDHSIQKCQLLKNIKHKFVFSLVLLFSFFCNINAQTFTTPEVYSFKQEVFRPVSYYTGQANISVPLCEIKTNEITIPISLNYIGGEGLRAINPYSSVGLGWKLSAGGAITRTKNGICDESTGTEDSGYYGMYGFFSWTATTTTTANDYVRNNASLYGGTGTSYNPAYEYSPDIFSFSFLGYSGYFVMGYDKAFHIQSNDIVGVEKNIRSPGNIGNIAYFTLTTNNGTKYTFGSKDGSVEFSGENPYQSEAWYLTKITFTNGQEVNFNYQDNTSSTGNMVNYKTSPNQNSYATIAPVILDNITFNGGKLVVTSKRKAQNISGRTDSLRIINQIDLKDINDKSVSTAYLKYTTYSSNRYYILDSLRVDGRRKYAFGYNSLSSLPNNTSALGTDYWGFYNGQSALYGVVTPTTMDSFLNQNLSSITQKVPNETYSKIGNLTSLTYPTGETEYYSYESHSYSKMEQQTYTGTARVNISNNPKAGGLRISQISRGNQVRKYKYVTNFDPNNPDDQSSVTLSSGILYKLPIIAYYTPAEAINFLSVDGEPSVTYSRVVEFLSDNSYTEYNMNSVLNKPDIENNLNSNYYVVRAKLNYVDNTSIFSSISKQTFIGALGKSSSCALERGNYSKIKYYDSSNSLKKTIRYTYSSNSNRYNQYVAGIYITAGPILQRITNLGFAIGLYYFNNANFSYSFTHSYCIYTFPVHLEKETTTEYIGGDSIQHVTKYRYNDRNLKSAIVTYDSKGDSIKTLFRYPADINTGNYYTMKTKSMLNFPIEQTTWKKNTITGGKLITYKANGSSYVPDQIYNMEVTTPFSPMNPDFNGTSKDTHYLSAEITYDSYGASGTVSQTTGRDGTTTAYLWDATGTYPLAQVKGATYSQISSLNGKASNYSSSTLWSEIKGLVPTTWPTPLISTYSYKPLVGITSITNPSNVTTNYTYDVNNKLYLVRNDDKNILQLYRYGYKNYPDNGRGGYSSMTGSVSTPQAVVINTPNPATASVSGGTGTYLYNWYLKNSSGTVVASTLNSTSNSYTFTTTQIGSYSVQCNAVDNSTGNSLTIYSSNFTSCAAICSFAMSSGYTNLSNSILNLGTTASFYISFYPTVAMQPNVSYLIATISSSCKPSSNRVINIDSVMGRSWEITITSSGYMYWKMTRGTALPAYNSESTGTLTYSL